MELNQHQKTALLLLLGNLGIPLHEVVFGIDSFCKGQIREWRIIGIFGMAGKLWNSAGKIYITGYSRSELNAEAFETQEIQIEQINKIISERMEYFR